MSALVMTQMSGLGLSPATLGVKNQNDLYVSLLKTRSVGEYVVDKCNLLEVTGKSRKQILRGLYEGLSVRDDKRSGIVTISYQHSNPKLAADIANSYVEGLQNLNNELAVTEAGQRRLFFEEQLRRAREALVKSEESLKSFQQRTGTVKVDDEAKAFVGSLAELRAKISAKEVQVKIMRSYATAENPDFIRLQEEVNALRGELMRIESKSAPDDYSVNNVGKISSLGTEYLRRMREFKYNESLYEILMKQYGAAKLDESKDASLIQVVEQAVPPESKSSPNRIAITLRAGVMVFFFLSLLVILRQYYSWTNDDDKKKIAEIVEQANLDGIISKISANRYFRSLTTAVAKFKG